MTDLHATLIELLARHVSPIIARSIVTRALREYRLEPARLTREDLHALRSRLASGLRVFTEQSAVDAFSTEISALAGVNATARETVTINVKTERDLADALSMTRRICDKWRVRVLARQRVATVVSELARNIVIYTPGGVVELIPIEGPRPRVLIRATDAGPGITNLDEVMGGTYKSKTGLGKGLLGSKRLADRFEIRSGRSGTIVEAELEL
jgi:serine/threonine-protein kinase RsbT